jgi:hypothetical protein
MKLIKFFCLILLSTNSYAQNETKLIKAYNNALSMSIPSDVDSMDAETIALKYRKRPDSKTYYYGNHDADFSIVVATVADGIKEAEMLKHKDELIAQLLDKGYKLEENTVRKVNNHDLIVVSFYSDVTGGKVFNKRFYAVVKSKMILVTFNSFGDKLEKRKQQIEESINSLIIQ